MPTRVLLAEPHTLVRKATRRVLERDRGIRVVAEAADGEEALRLAQELRPHVVLIDVALPLLNGIEATRRIKATCPDTAVIGLTVFEDEAYLFALLEAGAAGCLSKTSHGRQLAAAVRSVRRGESVLSPALMAAVLERFANPSSHAHVSQIGELTPPDLAVLRQVVKGASNESIARELGLTLGALQLRLRRIFRKMGVASRTEAALLVLKSSTWLS